MKMLIVDDHQLVRDGLHHVLTQLGTQDNPVAVLEEASYGDALACADRNPDLDLLLLDLCLPDVAGYAALVDLQESHPDIPVVIMSGLDDPGIVRECMERGAMGFIPKSSSTRVILQALRLVLSGGIYLPRQALEEIKERPLPVAVAPPLPQPAITPQTLGLTERQAEVLKLIIAGKTNKMICRELTLAEGTVKNHVAALLKVFNVTTRVQIVLVAAKIGLSWGTRH
jgi:DNA-binding NarL/FixJ family response regulator